MASDLRRLCGDDELVLPSRAPCVVDDSLVATRVCLHHLQVEALRPEDCARLRIGGAGCELERNVGEGLRVAGRVRLECDGLAHEVELGAVTELGGDATLGRPGRGGELLADDEDHLIGI